MRVYRVKLLNTNPTRGGAFLLTEKTVLAEHEVEAVKLARDDFARNWPDQPTLDIRTEYLRRES